MPTFLRLCNCAEALHMHFHTSPAGRHIDSTSHRLVGKGCPNNRASVTFKIFRYAPLLLIRKTGNLTASYEAVLFFSYDIQLSNTRTPKWRTRAKYTGSP